MVECEKPTNFQSDRLLSAYVDLEAHAIYEMEMIGKTLEGEILTDWLLSRTWTAITRFSLNVNGFVSDISFDRSFLARSEAIEALAKPKWVKFIKSHCKAFYASDQWEKRYPDGPISSAG